MTGSLFSRETQKPKIGSIIIKKVAGDNFCRFARLLSERADMSQRYAKTCRRRQADGLMDIYLAELQGECALCGYVILNFKPKYKIYRRLAIPAIQDLFVCSVYRRRGIGRSLLKVCEDAARRRGDEALGISVPVTSQYGAAQTLYVDLGYRPDGNGVTYDRQPVTAGEVRPVDDNLCLMLIKRLSS